MSILEMIHQRKIKIRKLGGIPVNIQLWEEDDDGLMYANSLLDQLESLQS